MRERSWAGGHSSGGADPGGTTYPSPAFTLIEVLVVVAILLLLAAVLFPSFATARESARTAVCSANIRQLVTANLGYAAENRDYFVPAAPDEPDGFGGRRRWHGMRKSAGVAADPDQNLFDPRFSPLARYIEGAPQACGQCHRFGHAPA